MGWISDIRDEIQRLDLSRKALRKFGLLVGSVLLILTGWLWFKSRGPVAVGTAGGAGFALILGGVFFPQILSGIYRLWMGAAFAMGWVMSRVLLIVLFYLVVVPTGIFARLAHKHFMAIDFKTRKDTYWLPKADGRRTNYEKMF
jgi:hypothetical protein